MAAEAVMAAAAEVTEAEVKAVAAGAKGCATQEKIN